MNSFRLKAALAASVAAVTLLPTNAFAQESTDSATAGTEDDGGFGIIIVTARKADEDLQKTPVAVTAVNADAIASLQLETATDVARIAPGLSARGAGTGPSAIVTYALRGNAQNSPNSVTDSAVGIYLDGVYLARPISSNLGFLDVANIQVVRGTQGTLFGRNTTGGAVQFSTVQPGGEFTGYVKGELGNYDHRLIEAAVTVPLSGDELSVRVAGRYTERGGYGQNFFTGAPLGDIESDVSTRATVRIAPASLPVTLTVSGEYLKSNDNGTMHALGAVNPAGPLATLYGAAFSAALPSFIQTRNNFYTNYGNTVNSTPQLNTARNFNEAYGFTGTLEVELGDLTLKSVTAYRDSDSGNTLDLDGTPAGGIEFDSQYEQHQFSEELQLSGSTDSLEWILGAYYFNESGVERSDSRALHDVTLLGGLALAPSGRNLTDFSSKSTAVFAQANYNLSDDLRVTAGLRYTWDKRNIDGHGVNNILGFPEAVFVSGVGVVVIQPNTCRVGPNSGTVPPVDCTAPENASFSYPAWTFGLDYQINPDMLVYAKTGGASLSGGFNTRPSPVGSESFQPEDVRDIEAGFKGEFLNRTLQTNLSVFHVWRNGAQNIVNGLVNGGLSQYAQNSGDIRSYGAELEFRALPWEGMEIRGAASRLWSSYAAGSFSDLGSYVDPVTGLNVPFDRSDETVAQTPKWTLNIGGTQTLETDFGEVGFHLDYSYISARNFGQETADLTNPLLTQAQIDQRLSAVAISNQLSTLDGYGILNGRVTIEFDNPNVELAVWGRNMLAEQYNQNVFSSYNQLGFVAYNAGSPSTYGATISFKW